MAKHVTDFPRITKKEMLVYSKRTFKRNKNWIICLTIANIPGSRMTVLFDNLLYAKALVFTQPSSSDAKSRINTHVYLQTKRRYLHTVSQGGF